MKYIDADKIRTEIKRLKAENNCGTDEFIAAKDIAYDKVFDFLEILEEPVSDDLEEAAEAYSRQVSRGHNYRDLTCGFIAGAEWQKAKMMEGAVEGTVIELGETYKDLSLSVNAKELNQVLQPLGVGDGNKVKIIIVKEEEQ